MVVRHFSWGQKMFHLKHVGRDEEGIERMVIWKKWWDWCQLSKTKIHYVSQNKMQKASPYLLEVQGTLWGLTRTQNILLLCFIKPDVEPPKCLPQTQLFWRSSWFLPILARHHDWLLHCSQRIVGSELWLSPAQTLAGTLALSLTTACFISPSCTRFLSSVLPAGLWKSCFALFLLQPGVLACFLSRNLKVGSQGLPCPPRSICFLYSGWAEAYWLHMHI